VTDELFVFVNQKTLYAYYSDKHFIEVLKGMEIRIPKERVVNNE
jgi:hypothetical protein